jgi:hypothetical protein
MRIYCTNRVSCFLNTGNRWWYSPYNFLPVFTSFTHSLLLCLLKINAFKKLFSHSRNLRVFFERAILVLTSLLPRRLIAVCVRCCRFALKRFAVCLFLPLGTCESQKTLLFLIPFWKPLTCLIRLHNCTYVLSPSPCSNIWNRNDMFRHCNGILRFP